jgi:ankyrin repeat protein
MSFEVINAVDKDGKTILHIAAEKGDREYCELLTPKMSSKIINAVSKDGVTALHCAAWRGMKEVCELLINKMTPETINVVTKDGLTTLHSAIFGRNKEIFDLIFRECLEVINAVDNYGFTVLHIAASIGLEGVCEQLIPRMSFEAINADAGYSGYTALHFAAEKGMKRVCELILERSPKAISAVDKYGRTALHLASSKGMVEVCELLTPRMNREAINAVNKDGLKVCDLLLSNPTDKGLEQRKEGINKLPALMPENAYIDGVKIVDPISCSNSLNTTWYDYLSIKNGLEKKGIQADKILESVENEEELGVILKQVTKPNWIYMVPLNVNAIDGTFTATNHWVGLYVITDASTKIVSIKYINPIGQLINQQLALKIFDLTTVKTEDLTEGKGIQFAYSKESWAPKLTGNCNDCGPMLVQLFHELAEHGEIRTHSLTLDQSIEFGQKCRKEQRWDKDGLTDAQKDEIFQKWCLIDLACDSANLAHNSAIGCDLHAAGTWYAELLKLQIALSGASSETHTDSFA